MMQITLHVVGFNSCIKFTVQQNPFKKTSPKIKFSLRQKLLRILNVHFPLCVCGGWGGVVDAHACMCMWIELHAHICKGVCVFVYDYEFYSL